jgi:nucleotide-binding universal stress UspA family protein
MFKRILVPVDGSNAAFRAVDKAIALAQAFSARIDLVTVVDVYPFGGIGADFAPGQDQFMAAATASANQALARAEAAVVAAGLACQRKTIDNHVVHQAILEAAGILGSDLIVMGSHGRHGLEKLLLGSTTQRVLAHTMLPVLVVQGS